jgi:hypothetical protein
MNQMAKPFRYIDIDDTIICEGAPGKILELRPGVVSQLMILSKLFRCRWLTHWDQDGLAELWTHLYAALALKNIEYFNWRDEHPVDKASAVLKEDHHFFWLEDPLSTGDLTELENADLMNRYIPVEPKGMFGFARACQKLFDKAGITDEDIRKVGGSPQWFKEPLTTDLFQFTIHK